MQFVKENQEQHHIQSYIKGKITINGTFYTKNLLISSDKIIEWPVKTLQTLTEEDISPILSLEPEVTILGSGEEQYFLSGEILNLFSKRQIGLEVMRTPSACRTFNILLAEGRKVVAALIL
jgi:uncharacterized protein